MKKDLTILETFDLAVQNHKKNNYQDAINLYNSILDKEPNHFSSILNLGSLFLQISKFDLAKPLLEKAIQIDPNNKVAFNNLGLTLKEMNETLQAINCFKKTILIDPNFSIAHNNLGTLLKDLGEIQKAIDCYKQAIKINPNYLNAYNNLGLTYMELQEYDKAIIYYEKAIKINPKFANTHNNLGVIFMELEQYEKATESFEKAIEINPNHLDASNNLLRFLFKMDDKTNFLNKLDDRINKGENNALIGSLITRSKVKYGIKRSNPFCKEPLSYIIKVNLNDQYDFKNIFVKKIKNIIESDKLLSRKQDLLTNGYQTAGNLFTKKNHSIDNIKKIVYSEVKKYQTHFKESNEGFIKNWPTSFSLNAWLVSMKSGGKLSAHIHEKGWLSGSIYINVPPKLKTDSGNLVVCEDIEENLTDKNKDNKKIIDVFTGTLCLFPSSLHHYTIPFESEEERIVLAFDVMPN